MEGGTSRAMLRPAACGTVRRMVGGDLGTFLRARREAVRPEDVGLPRGERRRTPGLRRSEVATLAGISVEYLTRLEQGRDRHPSTQVVAAVADALRLDRADRTHLHHLIAISQGTELVCGDSCPGQRPPPPELLRLLDRLEPTPAVLTAPGTELVAWGEVFDRLVRPVGMLDGEPPQLIRYAFGDDRARDAVADWETLADELVAWLHLRGGRGTAGIVTELSESVGPEFTTRWQRRPTGSPDLGLRTVMHPDVGRVDLSAQVLQAGDGLDLVALLPADAGAEAALDELAGKRPRALRQVAP